MGRSDETTFFGLSPVRCCVIFAFWALFTVNVLKGVFTAKYAKKPQRFAKKFFKLGTTNFINVIDRSRVLN